MNAPFTEIAHEGIFQDRLDLVRLFSRVEPELVQEMMIRVEEMERCPVCGEYPLFVDSWNRDNQPLYQFRCCGIHTFQASRIVEAINYWNLCSMRFPHYLRLVPDDVVSVSTPELKEVVIHSVNRMEGTITTSHGVYPVSSIVQYPPRIQKHAEVN